MGFLDKSSGLISRVGENFGKIINHQIPRLIIKPGLKGKGRIPVKGQGSKGQKCENIQS